MENSVDPVQIVRLLATMLSKYAISEFSVEMVKILNTTITLNYNYKAHFKMQYCFSTRRGTVQTK